MPLIGILLSEGCKVNTIAAIISTQTINFDNLEVKDLLEIIKILLNYIKEQKKNKD